MKKLCNSGRSSLFCSARLGTLARLGSARQGVGGWGQGRLGYISRLALWVLMGSSPKLAQCLVTDKKKRFEIQSPLVTVYLKKTPPLNPHPDYSV